MSLRYSLRIIQKSKVSIFIINILILILIIEPLFTEEDLDKNCYKCHDLNNLSYFNPDLKSIKNLTVKKEDHKNSVHANLNCISCHKETSSFPHAENRQKVGCNQDCHTVKEGEIYTHEKSYSEFSDSIHSKGKDGKSVDSPTCVNCHGVTSVHKITKVTKKISDSEKISQCITCHDNKEMMARNKVEESAVESYKKSFHYKAIKFGTISSAVCQDCHGVHDIYSKQHPKSRISDEKVEDTCSKSGCHEGANINFAMSGANHLNFKVDKEPILWWEEKMFQILTGGTMGMLVIGIALDVQKKYGWLSLLVKIGKFLWFGVILIANILFFLISLLKKL
jgi:hypothetical protein